MIIGGATLTIDTTSARGAWATAIAHTPHLAAQVALSDWNTSAAATRCAGAGEVAATPCAAASPILEERE